MWVVHQADVICTTLPPTAQTGSLQGSYFDMTEGKNFIEYLFQIVEVYM